MGLPVIFGASASKGAVLAATGGSALLLRKGLKKRAYFNTKPSFSKVSPRNAAIAAHEAYASKFKKGRNSGVSSKLARNSSEVESSGKDTVKSSERNDKYDVRIKNYNIVRYTPTKSHYKKKSYKNKKYKKGGRK